MREEGGLPTLLGHEAHGRPVRRESPPALPVRARTELSVASHGPLLAALAAQRMAAREDLHGLLRARPQVTIKKRIQMLAKAVVLTVTRLFFKAPRQGAPVPLLASSRHLQY